LVKPHLGCGVFLFLSLLRMPEQTLNQCLDRSVYALKSDKLGWALPMLDSSLPVSACNPSSTCARRPLGFGHSRENGDLKVAVENAVTDRFDKDLTGATRQDRTGDLLITNQPLYQLS
jgi:hypothetical protein